MTRCRYRSHGAGGAIHDVLDADSLGHIRDIPALRDLGLSAAGHEVLHAVHAVRVVKGGQRPRVPVWVAAKWPSRRPIRRAIRWDGLFPIDLPGPEQLAVLAEEIDQARRSEDRFDLVVELTPGADVRPWEAAGATWALTSFEPQSPEHAVREVIEAGP